MNIQKRDILWKKNIYGMEIYIEKRPHQEKKTHLKQKYIRKNLYSKEIIQNGTYTKKEYI